MNPHKTPEDECCSFLHYAKGDTELKSWVLNYTDVYWESEAWGLVVAKHRALHLLYCAPMAYFLKGVNHCKKYQLACVSLWYTSIYADPEIIKIE